MPDAERYLDPANWDSLLAKARKLKSTDLGQIFAAVSGIIAERRGCTVSALYAEMAVAARRHETGGTLN